MLPGGVIAVLAIVFVIACFIFGLVLSKWLNKRKNNVNSRKNNKRVVNS